MLKNDYYIDYYIKVDSHIRIKMNSTRDQRLFANIVIEKKEMHCKCHHWKEKTTLLVILDSELFSQEEVWSSFLWLRGVVVITVAQFH